MQEWLPRETFKSGADAANEADVAEVLQAWAGARYLRIGTDDPARQKSRIDGCLFSDDRVRAFVEIKARTCRFGSGDSYVIAEKKIRAARDLHAIVRVPVLVAVRFGCGAVAYVDSAQAYSRLPHWGRSDRNSPGDIETGAAFDWRDLKIIAGIGA